MTKIGKEGRTLIVPEKRWCRSGTWQGRARACIARLGGRALGMHGWSILLISCRVSLLLAGMFLVLLRQEALAAEDCGAVGPNMWDHYPVDYRVQADFQLKEVLAPYEQSGKAKDVAKLLLFIPNHPVGLRKMMQMAESGGSDTPSGSPYSLDCWFDRASRWTPDDPVVPKLYGSFLAKRKRYPEALEQFLKVEKLQGLTPTLSYDLALIYFQLGQYDLSARHARSAYQGGVNFPSLKEKLMRAGAWKEEPVVPSTQGGMPEMPSSAAQGDRPAETPGSQVVGTTADLPNPPEGEDCGKVTKNADGFGPYDYRTNKNRLPIVEHRHFTYEVEHLIRGTTGTVPGDIRYTLGRFPNHHRALIAMMRYLEKIGKEKTTVTHWTMGCYLDRAARWRPDDSVVRTIYGAYLMKKARYADAARQFEIAIKLDGGTAEAQYNLGLAYFRLRDYDKALDYAHKAYAGGCGLPGLRAMLEAKGKWREAPPGTGSEAGREAQAGERGTPRGEPSPAGATADPAHE